MSVACDGPADCAAGFACVGGVCRQPCVEPSECADGLSCGPSGFCVQCASDDECASDMYCGEGICRPDACLARSSSCESATSVKVCSERGDTEVTFACSGDSSCVGAEGEKWCSGWLCKPGQARCALEGNVAEVCSEDGAHLSEVACGDEAVCVEGECAPLVCEPGEKLCKDGSSHTCNGLGTGSKLDDFCSEGEYCDPDSGLCAFQLCEPNQVGCFENQTGVCDELGSAYEELKACKGTEVCVDGACEPVICTPYATSCENGSVHLCDETGTRTELYEACDASTQYCQQYSGYAYCTYDICEGGAPACNGNVLTTCMVDGSGYQPGGTPCGDGEACVDGECLVTVCSSYSLFCENDDLRVCNATGTGSELYRDCTSNQFCNAATNSCSARICTPGATSCTGNVTRTCNTFGSGYVTGTDCATVPGTACDAGECRPVVCTPSAYSCDQQTLNRCNALGTGLASSYVCPTYEHCFAEGGSAYCRYDLCTAGAPVCDGNTTATCAADGSGPGALGTDCSLAGEACTGGTCRPVVCTVGAMACHNGDFQYCIDNGTAFSLADDCSSSEYCNPVSGCLPQVCVPGVPMCSGEVATTCAADGSGPAAGGTDCAAAEGVCYEATCQPVVCTGAEWSCTGNVLRHCQNRGTLEETTACGAEQSCSATRQRCLERICEPGVTTCLDSAGYRTCNASGTGYDEGTLCGVGERCEAGICGVPSSLCSIGAARWTDPSPLGLGYAAYGFGAGVDDQDNLLVASVRWGDGQFVLRYDNSSGIWEDAGRVDTPVATQQNGALAVSRDGSAIVASYTRSGQANYVRHFDSATKAWAPQVHLGFAVRALRLYADARGNFVAFYVDAYDSPMAATYRPAHGWSAFTAVNAPVRVPGGMGQGNVVTVSLRGQAAISWVQTVSGSHTVWWSRSSLASGIWSAPERLSIPSDAGSTRPQVAWADSEPGDAVVVYFSNGSEFERNVVTSLRWTAADGLHSRAVLGEFAVSSVERPPLVRAANGDAFLFFGTTVARLPVGASVWEITAGVGPGPDPQVVAFANGDLLAVAESGIVSRYVGGVWSQESLGPMSDFRLVKLSGCRAALFHNSQNGVTARYLQ